MKHVNWWTVYWLGIWFGLGFGVPETYALITNPRNTLSDTAWQVFGVVDGEPIWHWGFWHFVLLAALVWLLFHGAWGWFR